MLLVSEDLDEIFELCDRIAVIFQGRFMGILESDDPRSVGYWIDDGRHQEIKDGSCGGCFTLKSRTVSRYPPSAVFVTLVLALAAGMVVIGLIFILCGVNPFFAFKKIFSGSFGSLYGLKETITKAIPLILIGGGLALAFKAKFWNIGAESQLLMGAIFGTWVGLNWGPALPAPVIVPLMFLAGFVGGALWGLIPAVLKIRFAINEVISTLMLNYICAEFLTLLIVGPWKSKKKFGFPYTDDLPDSAILSLFPGSRIHTATLILGRGCRRGADDCHL